MATRGSSHKTPTFLPVVMFLHVGSLALLCHPLTDLCWYGRCGECC